jgi:hypothetical protein
VRCERRSSSSRRSSRPSIRSNTIPRDRTPSTVPTDRPRGRPHRRSARTRTNGSASYGPGRSADTDRRERTRRTSRCTGRSSCSSSNPSSYHSCNSAHGWSRRRTCRGTGGAPRRKRPRRTRIRSRGTPRFRRRRRRKGDLRRARPPRGPGPRRRPHRGSPSSSTPVSIGLRYAPCPPSLSSHPCAMQSPCQHLRDVVSILQLVTWNLLHRITHETWRCPARGTPTRSSGHPPGTGRALESTGTSRATHPGDRHFRASAAARRPCSRADFVEDLVCPADGSLESAPAWPFGPPSGQSHEHSVCGIIPDGRL